MDELALLCVSLFFKRNGKLRRLVLGAGIGAVINLLLVVFLHNRILFLICNYIFLHMVMIGVAFGCHGKRWFMENMGATYLFQYLFGGMLEWLGELSWMQNRFVSKVLFLGGMMMLLFWGMERYRQYEEQLVRVCLRQGERELLVYAYWDSGNQLTDPYTGAPVHIMNRKIFRKLTEEKEVKMRLVPFFSLGEKNGMLSVGNLDGMEIESGGKRYLIKPAVVGVADEILFDKKEYDMILHASMRRK